MNAFFLVFVGAGFGGALRHAVNLTAARILGSGFPYGTVAVNVLGSLAMGILTGYFSARLDPGHPWKLLLTTGVLGGFTTFSTFSLDAVALFERGDASLSALYTVGSVVASVAALLVGLIATRSVLGN